MIIKSADYIISCVSKKDYPKNDWPNFVFLGRSNVGKSSLINALTNRKKLAYTSSKPGKTLTLNFYEINHNFYLVDVPGYGYAQKSIDQRLEFGNMIEEYLKNATNLKICFLIIDFRHDITADDLIMYNYLTHYSQNVYVIATKADKLSKNEINKNYKSLTEKLDIDKDKIIIFSAITKLGVNEVLDIIEHNL